LSCRQADVAKKLSYFDQVLSGVEAAHLQRVTHRDLKPENVLYNKASDLVVVADFGIAHFTDEELYTAVETAPNARLANFEYSAPEQRSRGRATDARTDIYSLGLMLNELFTGDVPHGAGYKKIVSVAPEYAWIDEIVEEMIQQDPERRPVSIDVVKTAFIAKRQDFVTRQRLSQIQNAVILVGDEDEPLALQPPQLIDFDWDRGKLTLMLDRPVNDGWVQAIRNMGGHTALWNKGPETFGFDRDRASVFAQESEVQNIIDYFKQWLPRATEVYRATRERARHEAAEHERSRLHAEQEALEQRRRLRDRIRL
jgi:serine/threonine protein kinase